MKNSTFPTETPALMQALLQLLAAHRRAFGQERSYRRALALVFGELFSFGRHTVTQALLALGLTDADWSAWYRLFSRVRFAEEELANCLLAETLVHAPEEQPYVIACDGTQMPRSSRKMPGTSWLKAPRTPAFRVGIHRAQHFLHGAWLTPREAGYSRAIPLRFLPAFPEKAVPGAAAPCREWQAGLQFVHWVRAQLDRLGRAAQPVLLVADGRFDVLDFWGGLPAGTVAAIRTAKNRALHELPQRRRQGFQRLRLRVRGRTIPLRYRVQGTYLREGLPDQPRRKYRKPAFYLISAQPDGQGGWQLPFPIETILAWLWQRWEVEVAHREMKSGFGVGQKQCWQPRATVVSVQWSVWVYPVLLLAGYRTWGLLGGPPPPARWWKGAQRWSLTTLWRSYRAAVWGSPVFRPLWTRTGANWLEKEAQLAVLHNAVLAAARI